MPVTVTPVFATVIGDRWMKVSSVVGGASYPTGGEPLTVGQLGFAATADPEFHVQGENSGGIDVSYDYTAQKLKAFSGAAEVTAATNLTAQTFRVTAIGRYSS